jgi:hypothetical protein
LLGVRQACAYDEGVSEPTLKDVVNAIAELRSETKGDLARIEGRLSTVEAKVDAHRAETAKSFAELDRELTKHADVHRTLEKDVEALKARAPRPPARPARRR